MKRNRTLTWCPRTRRWRGSWQPRGGRRVWFSYPADTKLASESAAYAAFRQWLAERESVDSGSGRAEWNRILENLLSYQAGARLGGDTLEARLAWTWAEGRIQFIRQAIDQGLPCPQPAAFAVATAPKPGIERAPPDGPAAVEVQLTDEQAQALLGSQVSESDAAHGYGSAPWIAPAAPAPTDSSLGWAIATYLAERARAVERGELSLSRVQILRYTLTRFAGHVGEAALAEVTSQQLAGYRESLLAEIHAGKLAPKSAADYAAAVRQFFGWAERMEMIAQLPAVLRGHGWAIQKPRNGIELPTADEVHAILGASADQHRLWWLLCLNCGFTQKDLADLDADEVKWENGRIARKRSKTGKHDTVPAVDYPLWLQTMALLRAHGHRESPVIRTERGSAVAAREMRPDGTIKKRDAVWDTWVRVAKKAGVQGRSPKDLRKFSATLLGSHPEYGRYAQYFLGHAPASVADRHYVKPDQPSFDRAVEWLGAQIVGEGDER